MAQKSLFKNALFNVVYRFTNILFPLVTTVYISHVLTASGVGKVSVAQNIAQYFVLLAPLGIVNYGTREIARRRDNSFETNKLFSELFFINLVSTLFCSFIYYSLVLNGNYFEEHKLLYCVTGLLIVFNVINVDWYYQGREEYVYISVRSIIVKFLSLILIFLFVKSPSDYVVYALIYVFGIAGNYLFNTINLIKEGVRLEIHNLQYTIHLKAIFLLFCSSIAIELYTLVDTTMLGYLCSNEVVGYYTNSAKLNRIVVGLISSIGMILLPRLSYCIKNGEISTCNNILSKIVMVMLFVAIPSGLGMFLMADSIVPVFFGNSFIPAILTARIGSILIFFLAFSNLFGTQVLLSFNQEKKLLLCTVIGASSNIIANIFLIPLFEHNGAITASVISELLVVLLSSKFAFEYLKVTIEASFWKKTFMSTIIMVAFVAMGKYLINDVLLSVIVSCMLGCIAYVASCYLVKHPVLLELKSILKARSIDNKEL